MPKCASTEIGSFWGAALGLSLNPFAQRLALQQRHDDKGLAFVFTELVDRANVWMIQSRGGARLLLKAGKGFGIGGQFAGQQFECNPAAQLQVLGLVDHSHAPATQQPDDAVVGYFPPQQLVAARGHGFPLRGRDRQTLRRPQ